MAPRCKAGDQAVVVDDFEEETKVLVCMSNTSTDAACLEFSHKICLQHEKVLGTIPVCMITKRTDFCDPVACL